MSRRIASASVLVATVCMAASSYAQTNAARSPWMAALEVGPQWHHDGSYAAFLRGSETPPAVGLLFGRDIAHLTPAFTLAAEVGWRLENTSGLARNVFDTQLVTNQLQASVTLRFDRWSWFAPYARLSGGAANLTAKFTDSNAGGTLSADAWVPWGGLGAGVMLTGGQWFAGVGARRLRAVLSVEGGYQLAMSTTLQASQPAPSNEAAAADRINSQSVSLGTLNPSAAYLRVVIGFRF